MKNQKTRRGGWGFSRTEMLIAINIIIVSLLGFDSALKEAHAQVRNNQEASLAEAELHSAVEEFRVLRMRDPEKTVAAYQEGVSRAIDDSPVGRNVRLAARLVPSLSALDLEITWDGVQGRRELHQLKPVPK
jgi:Tfp pilus assembly protein PilV